MVVTILQETVEHLQLAVVAVGVLLVTIAGPEVRHRLTPVRTQGAELLLQDEGQTRLGRTGEFLFKHRGTQLLHPRAADVGARVGEVVHKRDAAVGHEYRARLDVRLDAV